MESFFSGKYTPDWFMTNALARGRLLLIFANRAELHRDTSSCIDKMSQVEQSLGGDREKTLAMLYTEPMTKWASLARLLKVGSETSDSSLP